MTTRQPGLRKRIEHEATGIRHQHELIAQLVVELSGALADGEPGRSRQGVARLRRALRAHFVLEEDVVFPAYRGLHPEHAAALDGLAAAHQQLWLQLERLEFSLEGADLQEAARLFAGLRDGLASHEQDEEALLASSRGD